MYMSVPNDGIPQNTTDLAEWSILSPFRTKAQARIRVSIPVFP
jgi:hypothetical protein